MVKGGTVLASQQHLKCILPSTETLTPHRITPMRYLDLKCISQDWNVLRGSRGSLLYQYIFALPMHQSKMLIDKLLYFEWDSQLFYQFQKESVLKTMFQVPPGAHSLSTQQLTGTQWKHWGDKGGKERNWPPYLTIDHIWDLPLPLPRRG